MAVLLSPRPSMAAVAQAMDAAAKDAASKDKAALDAATTSARALIDGHVDVTVTDIFDIAKAKRPRYLCRRPLSSRTILTSKAKARLLQLT